ncbi:MAG TPA: hypothetical protein VGN26_21675 [Armatimonadota bacterium]|jgi:hypothetical protein
MSTIAPLMMGFAEVEFTPEPGLSLAGQMHTRRATHARDPLMACAVAFAQGDERVVLVSTDVCVLPEELVRETQASFQDATGVPGARLLLHATHTHDAPATTPLLGAEVSPGFLTRLRAGLVGAAKGALSRLEPVALSGGSLPMAEMGWNRRAMFEDGGSRMYGHSEQPGFAGMEGPRDPALSVLCARSPEGTLRGVVLSFSTHPNSIEAECFYSADVPGEVRRQVRERLGPAVGAVYLTGPAGNTAPSILDPHDSTQPWRGEAGLLRSGAYLAEGVASIVSAHLQPMPHPVLRLEQAALEVPIRPWPSSGDRCQPHPWDAACEEVYRQAKECWPERLSAESPVSVRLNVLRVGDAAICACPAELFVEYGLRIRELSPAKVNLLAELTDGYVGYVPTRLAFQRGGYETWPAPTSQLVPEAGDPIVETTTHLLRQAFAR